MTVTVFGGSSAGYRVWRKSMAWPLVSVKTGAPPLARFSVAERRGLA